MITQPIPMITQYLFFMLKMFIFFDEICCWKFFLKIFMLKIFFMLKILIFYVENFCWNFFLKIFVENFLCWKFLCWQYFLCWKYLFFMLKIFVRNFCWKFLLKILDMARYGPLLVSPKNEFPGNFGNWVIFAVFFLKETPKFG